MNNVINKVSLKYQKINNNAFNLSKAYQNSAGFDIRRSILLWIFKLMVYYNEIILIVLRIMLLLQKINVSAKLVWKSIYLQIVMEGSVK